MVEYNCITLTVVKQVGILTKANFVNFVIFVNFLEFLEFCDFYEFCDFREFRDNEFREFHEFMNFYHIYPKHSQIHFLTDTLSTSISHCWNNFAALCAKRGLKFNFLHL